MDQKVFKKNMELLFGAFGKKVNEGTVKAYWNFLKHMDEKEFTGKCEELIKTEKFFPTISCFYQNENDPFAGAI